ncbi:MAG: 50S ribosomal protein L21 [bacterium]|nr:50S ribosomal protein L21 [bacterium]
MHAVVEIAGTQFAVSPKQTLKVPLLAKNAGDSIEFNNILLASDNGKISLGAPFLSGSVVKATVNGHERGEKVLVFKKKRRKGYQKLNGHRQQYTSITITDITI